MQSAACRHLFDGGLTLPAPAEIVPNSSFFSGNDATAYVTRNGLPLRRAKTFALNFLDG
jgi:hypothetical protein